MPVNLDDRTPFLRASNHNHDDVQSATEFELGPDSFLLGVMLLDEARIELDLIDTHCSADIERLVAAVLVTERNFHTGKLF